MRKIYTVGHSSHHIEHFIDMLKAHSVNCIVDVRSVPYSKFKHFCKEELATSLKRNSIFYLPFADEFGARRKEKALLDEQGKVDFEKVRSTAPFQRGVERLKNGAQKGFTIALMCAEAEPLECHRFGMVVPALRNEFEVLHILKDKRVKTNAQLEKEMLLKYKVSDLKEAYRLHNRDIAYTPYK
jgi:uncharacterized protein (DUF488 family)